MYTVYVKDNCPYCVKAKSLLEKEGLNFETVDAVENKALLIERVLESGNPLPRSVPQIFDEGKYVGGYDQLCIYLSEEKPVI